MEREAVKKLKTPKRVNHKGETVLHMLAIKVRYYCKKSVSPYHVHIYRAILQA